MDQDIHIIWTGICSCHSHYLDPPIRSVNCCIFTFLFYFGVYGVTLNVTMYQTHKKHAQLYLLSNNLLPSAATYNKKKKKLLAATIVRHHSHMCYALFATTNIFVNASRNFSPSRLPSVSSHVKQSTS